MRIVIIEDEPLTAEDLAETLQQADAGVEIEAILSSVKNAISYFQKHDFPDLIFSDIQLGDGLSFEVFKAVPTSTPVVFCTAYDVYALDAFKANGIDYVLKPFTVTSIANTLQKYKKLRDSFSQTNTSFKNILDLFENKLTQKRSSILVYQRDKIIPLAVSDIALASIENQLTRVHSFSGGSYVVNHTLDELENILSAGFFRANRQHLISHKAVKEVSQYFGRKLHIALAIPFPDEVLVSKVKSPLFLEWLASH